MRAGKQLAVALAWGGACLACGAQSEGPAFVGTAEPTGSAAAGSPSSGPAPTAADEITPQGAVMYLQYIGPGLLGRTLSDAEIDRVKLEGAAAIAPLLHNWFAEPGFAEAVRGMMELKLSASGTRGGVDFGLPGYLVRHVVQNRLPWSQVLTSTTCYSESDAPIPCDTGAPYTAGVLTTRGFLAGNEGRFNLSRAHTMLGTFMCRDYPHEEELQPRVEREKLKLMFRATSEADQKVAEAAGGFGNGLACYSCHGQFSLHAQPFVKFDKSGLYLADATGLQSLSGQLGEGENGTAASHWEAADVAKLEAAQWFGTEIANLVEGAAVIAKHDKFRECTLQNLLDLAIGISAAYETGIKGLKADPAFLSEIAGAVASQNPDPPLQDLAVALYADPRVIATTIDGMKR